MTILELIYIGTLSFIVWFHVAMMINAADYIENLEKTINDTVQFFEGII
jgi:hypothetical protein